MAIPQTFEDLNMHLLDEFRFLVTSSKSFDGGFEGEAKRLAVAIRVLVHDTRHSISLLKQLKSENIYFLDTCHDYIPGSYFPHMGLVCTNFSFIGGHPCEGKYMAPLQERLPFQAAQLSFQRWWEKIVIIDNRKSQFSRRDLILGLSNHDGGAHVDPSLPENYAMLSRANTIGWKIFSEGLESDIENSIVFSSVRQIAFEVIETLKARFDFLR